MDGDGELRVGGSPVADVVWDLARRYLGDQTPAEPIEGVLVLLCGVTHSGKTTLALRDPGLRRLARIEADALRSLIALRAHDLRRSGDGEPVLDGLDGTSSDRVAPQALAARRSVLRELTDAVFSLAFRLGVGVLHDASNKSASERRARLEQACAAGYRTAIAEVTCPLETVIARLEAHDDALEGAGQPRFWRGEYERHHAETFDVPDVDEADEVVVVPFDTDSPVPMSCLR